MGYGIAARRKLLENYYLEKGNRDVFERVATRMNIKSYARGVMNMIMLAFFSKAPVETGYGRSVGIRYKQATYTIDGKKKRYVNHFIITIGSDTNAVGGQTVNAPYMAIQNVLPSNEGWIQDALYKARAKIKELGIQGYVYINNPVLKSKYVTKNGQNRPSGYTLEVIFSM